MEILFNFKHILDIVKVKIAKASPLEPHFKLQIRSVGPAT